MCTNWFLTWIKSILEVYWCFWWHKISRKVSQKLKKMLENLGLFVNHVRCSDAQGEWKGRFSDLTEAVPVHQCSWSLSLHCQFCLFSASPSQIKNCEYLANQSFLQLRYYIRMKAKHEIYYYAKLEPDRLSSLAYVPTLV